MLVNTSTVEGSGGGRAIASPMSLLAKAELADEGANNYADNIGVDPNLNPF